MRNHRFLLIDNARPGRRIGGIVDALRDGAGGVGRWVLRNILVDTGGTEEGNGRMAQSQWRIERGKKRRDTRKGNPGVPQCERGCATGKLRPQGWGEPQAENGLSSYYTFPIAIIWRGKAKRGVGYAQPAERTWRSEGPKTASSSSTWRWNSCLMSWHGAPWRVWRGFPWKRFVPFARLQIRRQGVVSSA